MNATLNKPTVTPKPLSGQQQVTWQVDCLVSQEEAPGDTSTVPGSGEGQDLTKPSHVVLEGCRANVTHSYGENITFVQIQETPTV